VSTEPAIGSTYAMPATFVGVSYTDYWRVVSTHRYSGHQVELQRIGGTTKRRIGLQAFRRTAKPSPR